MRSSSSASTSSITSLTRAVRGYLLGRGHTLTPVRSRATRSRRRAARHRARRRRNARPWRALAQLRVARRDDGHRDRAALPLVVVVDLGDRDVEPVPQPVDDRADRGALRLQRSTLRDVQIETERGCVHLAILAPRGVSLRHDLSAVHNRRSSAQDPQHEPGRDDGGQPDRGADPRVPPARRPRPRPAGPPPATAAPRANR